jgi:hypothetical protein
MVDEFSNSTASDLAASSGSTPDEVIARTIERLRPLAEFSDPDLIIATRAYLMASGAGHDALLILLGKVPK